MLKDDDIAAIKSILLNDVIDKIETNTDINGQLIDKIHNKPKKDQSLNGDILTRIFSVNHGRISQIKASCKNNLTAEDKKIKLILRAKDIIPMLIDDAKEYMKKLTNNSTIFHSKPKKIGILFSCINNPNNLDGSLQENEEIEYKAIFEEKKLNKYLKTIAGFANNKGGRIIFGIKDHSLEILGINNYNKMQNIGKHLDEKILSYLGCSVKYTIEKEILLDKTIGILNVKESLNKPLIFNKSDSEKNIEGGIYYRYNALTGLIKKQDLDTIIHQRKSQDLSSFMSMIQSNINSSGVDNLAILNLATGQVTGKANAFYVDEKLISQIKFINEGSFCEKTGTPTLKLVGEVKPIIASKTVIEKEIIKDPHDKYSLTYKNDLIPKLKEENINQNTLNKIINKYNLKKNEDFCYPQFRDPKKAALYKKDKKIPKTGVTFTYTPAIIDEIIRLNNIKKGNK
jgi:hypothetical protein